MSEYIDKEDALKEVKAWSMYGKDDLVSRLENLPSIEIDDDSLILSHEAYSDLCLRAAGRLTQKYCKGCKYRKKGRQKASKPNTCGTCKWRCGRKTSVGIECMQPDNQKKWQAKDIPHRECCARYKQAGATCKRYERKEQEEC